MTREREEREGKEDKRRDKGNNERLRREKKGEKKRRGYVGRFPVQCLSWFEQNVAKPIRV